MVVVFLLVTEFGVFLEHGNSKQNGDPKHVRGSI